MQDNTAGEIKMSIWYEIENPDDIDFSEDGEEMHILYKDDSKGNHYVSILVKLVREKLEELESKR